MFLEIILSLVTIIIFSLFALRPTIITIISLVKEIDEKESVLAKLDKKINDLEIASDVYLQREQDLPTVLTAVPNSPTPDTLVRQIEGLANKNSVGVLGVSINEVTLVGKSKVRSPNAEYKPLPEGAKEMAVSISTTGAYQNLNAMIKDIENLRIPVKVDVLGINASDTEEGRIIVAIISARVPFIGNEN